MRHIRRKLLLTCAALAVFAAPLQTIAATSEAEYHAVVKLVESYFHVKHKGVPFLATAGLRAAKIVSSDVRKAMHYGDFKLAIFEDQDFAAHDGTVEFHRLLRETLQPAAWSPLVAVRDRSEGLTYTYVKADGEKFKVLIVALAQRDGTVLQVDLNREEFAKLLQDPEQESRNITDQATSAAKDDN